jgi:hypothetical protein
MALKSNANQDQSLSLGTTNQLNKEGIKMQHMTEKLGSWQISGGTDSGKVRFRLFFPNEENGLLHNIQTIRVCGDFQKALDQPENWVPTTAPELTKSLHSEGEIWSYRYLR